MGAIPLVVIGTRNAGKASEIGIQLAAAGIPWTSLAEFPHAPEITEDRATFAENARKKAAVLAAALQQWVLAEDSGLEVDALGGAPGVYSARFAGPSANDRRNYELLLQRLKGVPPERRSARFVCYMVLADPAGSIQVQVCETCHGRITFDPRGQSGFGYDPVFEIPEYHRTFAELGPVVKNAISHRGRAVRQMIRHMKLLFDAQSPHPDQTTK